MRIITKLVILILVLIIGALLVFTPSGCITEIASSLNYMPLSSKPKTQVTKYRGIIFAPEFTEGAQEFIEDFELLVTEALVPSGINLIVFDMHWSNYHFTSIPELKSLEKKASIRLAKEDATKIAEISRRNGIHVMVGMNFLTHQDSGQLLQAFPKLQWPGNEKLWNPLDDQVNPIAFKMADELIEAFNPVGFHVGMDEGHGFDTKKLPGAIPHTSAELFSREINKYYNFLVKEKGVDMLMWADMLEGRYIDAPVKDALSMIPKDIILVSWDYICEWRYPWLGEIIEKVIPICPYDNEWPRKLADEGFRVMISPWKNPRAAFALAKSTDKIKTDKFAGILYTTWSPNVVQDLKAALLNESVERELDPTVVGVSESIRSTIELFTRLKYK